MQSTHTWHGADDARHASLQAAMAGEVLSQLRLVTRGTTTSLEEVAEAVRREPAWAEAFSGFSDPRLRLDAQEYVELARGLGLQALSSHSAMKRWDFGSDDAFFGFCNAGFGAWTQALPEARRRAFVEAVMRRYQALRAAAFGERHRVHFMQTDLVLAPAA